MKDKEERKLQFVLRYYEDEKLDTELWSVYTKIRRRCG